MLEFRPNSILVFLMAPQAQGMGGAGRKGKLFIWLLKMGSV